MSGTSQGRRRIAVLGGGCGAMAALWGLLQSDKADDYDITVYQIGWRLGGKGASGRNASRGQRIEEHGLHMWQGFYENAFHMMRSVYRELDRPPDQPLSRVFHHGDTSIGAFTPMRDFALAERRARAWSPWRLRMPPNDDVPGSGTEMMDPQAIIEELIEGIIEMAVSTELAWELEAALHFLDRLLPRVLTERLRVPALEHAFTRFAHAILRHRHLEHLRAARAAARRVPRSARARRAAHHRAVLEPLERFERVLAEDLGDLLESVPGLEHLYVCTNVARAVIAGIFEDGLLEHGFDSVDDQEFSAWLSRHGASDRTIGSAIVRGWYAFYFAAPQEGHLPGLSASTGLRTLIRCNATYKGAYFWKMSAGMGDVVFAPIYEVASRRPNVRFEFFTAVRRLRTDGRRVTGIDVERQVDLKPGLATYAPLVDVKGLPCWPSEPLYEQLDDRQASALRAAGADLERLDGGWEPASRYSLEHGEDFDDVILGIAQPALAALTAELCERNLRWRLMVHGMPSAATQAVQLWFDEAPAGSRWLDPPTIGTAFAEPLNTWAEMSHLLEREDWGRAPERPRSIVYLCDACTEPADGRTVGNSSTRAAALAWLEAHLHTLWPNAGLDTLSSPPDTIGLGRFDAQYWRNNHHGSERYVLSPPGTASLRLRADESGFDNLFLAGDWLATGLNVGCVEAAVMGGLQASQAISGWPRAIVGDGEFLCLERARARD